MKKIKVNEKAEVDNIVYEVGIHNVDGYVADLIIASGKAIDITFNTRKLNTNVANTVLSDVVFPVTTIVKNEDDVDNIEISEKILEKLKANGIDLKTARMMTVEELVSLDGIGLSTAKKILS